MKRFRITKYNPAFRNESGEYLLDEWTSIYDIGKSFHEGILKELEYMQKEESYLRAIMLLLNENDIQQMCIVQLEKYIDENFFDSISEEEQILIQNIEVNMLVTIDKIMSLSRMILRELIWAKFETLDREFVLEFGYDYYMYVSCEKISDERKEDILKLGLFVEEM